MHDLVVLRGAFDSPRRSRPRWRHAPAFCHAAAPQARIPPIQLFSSQQLQALVADVIANNPTLQAAQASLRQSQEMLRAGYGVFFPQIDAGFDATRQKFSPIRFGQCAASSIFNLFTLSASVSYTLDIFGRERRHL